MNNAVVANISHFLLRLFRTCEVYYYYHGSTTDTTTRVGIDVTRRLLGHAGNVPLVPPRAAARYRHLPGASARRTASATPPSLLSARNLRPAARARAITEAGNHAARCA